MLAVTQPELRRRLPLPPPGLTPLLSWVSRLHMAGGSWGRVPPESCEPTCTRWSVSHARSPPALPLVGLRRA